MTSSLTLRKMFFGPIALAVPLVLSLLLLAPVASAAGSCTSPPGEIGAWRYDGGQNQWFVCTEVSPGTFTWRPASGEPNAPAFASPDEQWERQYNAVTEYTVSVRQNPGGPLTLVMDYGDGTSETAIIPQGSSYTAVQFTHNFYYPEFPGGSSYGVFTQTATILESGLSDSSTTIHDC